MSHTCPTCGHQMGSLEAMHRLRWDAPARDVGGYQPRAFDDTPKPPPRDPSGLRAARESELRVLLADMNASNWGRKRDEALDLLIGDDE